jgi:ribosomal protein S18 acetylase RimI-like enzyme
MAWLAEQGNRDKGGRFSKIRLRVNRGNHLAIRAYQRAGFEITEELCNDIGGGFVMDDYVMVRMLDGARSKA